MSTQQPPIQNKLLRPKDIKDIDDLLVRDVYKVHMDVDKIRRCCVDAYEKQTGERLKSSAAFTILSLGFNDEDQYVVMSPINWAGDRKALIKHLEAAIIQLKTWVDD